MAKRVGELRKAETERGVVRATQRRVAALSDGQELANALRKSAKPLVRLTDVADARNANAPLAALALIDSLEAYVDGSTAEAEREQAAERVAQAEQDERYRQEVAEYRCQFPGVAVPNN